MTQLIKVVGFLQNAWSPTYSGGEWPRASWLSALRLSRSGQRLKVLSRNCHSVEIWWDNTTTIVGACPDSVVPPDLNHMTRVIHDQEPHYVVAFGKQAAASLRPLVGEIPFLILPHPAYRVVTNELLELAGKFLEQGFKGTVELRQNKTGVETIFGVYTN